ncbi:DEAD/DEAH box helicase [Haloarchaeobius amylolyticus]|uniref:DEAD/DEAH box helicase n=1 Tax=Haloarchaeobius amylolyticus TaxID=1198296 RepID=UPI00226EBE7A|nr:DEAD/DEAH box helicase [Haloarchaeobius amylolyticus]
MTADAAAFTVLGDVVRGALSERGFRTPTETQARAIPAIAEGRHTLVVAPTGTGKTETAMLPVFDALVGEERFGIGALYVTPLRALNRDMRERLDWWGEELGLDIDVRHGDTSDYQRSKQANDPPDVLVTTPETVQAMLTGSKLRVALEDVQHIVVDEVHELAASKRGAQLTIAMERLRELAGDFQRIGLSATVGDPDAVGAFLTGGADCAIRQVDVGSNLDLRVVEPDVTDEDGTLASELMTDASVASHVRTIRDIVAENESTLIFVNTRQTAEALGSRFKELDLPIGVHHGSLSKQARIEVEDAFKAGDIDALLCTSSMELGIDVGRIDHVVQYQSPRQVARLLQRVGRAGHRRDEVSAGTIVTTRADDTFEALAITRQAKAGEVEPAGIHEGSLDVVANQIPGLAMDFGEISGRKAYDLVTRAYPFRDLSEDDFRAVVRELHGNRVVWLDEQADTIEKTGGTWQYVYANLSMIPDEETYEVYDMAAGQQVGTLDERFVTTFASPGEVFIQRGEMWRIVEVDDETSKVKVSPIEDPAGEVPTWVGQEIPVPESVAREVGEMRAVAEPQFARGAPRESVAREFCSRYPTDEHTASSALEQFERQVEAEAPMPTADRLVVEGRATTFVVNAPFGHKVNATLGRLLSALLGQRTGSTVGLDTDPYRIELEVPSGVALGEVEEVLRTTDPDHVEPLIELSLKNSDSLKFRLSQVAAKFGALKRWEGSGISGDRLLAALRDTPMYDEAVREVFHEDLAVEATSAVLEAIQADDLEVVLHGDLSPIGTDGRSAGKELLSPENADASVIETVKERIQNDRVILFCLHCQEYERTKKVRRVRDQPECPKCGSTQIAALNPWADEVVTAVRASEKDEEQEKQTERAYRAASLVQSHGKQAVIALAARGVGPHNAARIINRLREDEQDFYRDILTQERQYARTQSFW